MTPQQKEYADKWKAEIGNNPALTPDQKRRAYKTRWQAEKRKTIQWFKAERIMLDIPHRLAADLREMRPPGWGFRQYLLRLLGEAAGRKPAPVRQAMPSVESRKAPVAPRTNTKRNSLCPCGSGKKFKRCCGGVCRDFQG